jgi:hypothetical protein
MKIIIGIILMYIILVISSASLWKYIWKGHRLEDTWMKSIKIFSIGYFIVGIILIMFFLIIHYIST